MIAPIYAEILKNISKDPNFYQKKRPPEEISYLLDQKLITFSGHPFEETCEKLTDDCYLWTQESKWSCQYKINDAGKIALYEFESHVSEKKHRIITMWISAASLVTGIICEYGLHIVDFFKRILG